MKISQLIPGTPQRVFLPPSNTVGNKSNQISRNRYGTTTGRIRQTEQACTSKKRSYYRTKTDVEVVFDGSQSAEWRDINRLQLAAEEKVA